MIFQGQAALDDGDHAGAVGLWTEALLTHFGRRYQKLDMDRRWVKEIMGRARGVQETDPGQCVGTSEPRLFVLWLSRWLPEWPENRLPELLTRIYIFEDPVFRYEALGKLAHRLASASPAIRAFVWRKMTDRASTTTRDDLVAEWSLLIPVVKSQGGIETLRGMASAIRDVCRWWP